MASSDGTGKVLLQLLLAGTGNGVAGVVTNPIDVVKVRMQMIGEGVASADASKRPGFVHLGRSLVKNEGLAALSAGVSASVCREMSYSGIRMGLYEPTKNMLSGSNTQSASLGLKVLSGAITGATGAVIANPFDLVKVRMQSSPGSGGRGTYSSVIAALKAIANEGGGIRGLWRGTGPTVQRATLLTASQVPCYDHFKHSMLDRGYMREGYICHFTCSMVAGFVAAVVTSPADLIKSRIMIQPVDPTGRGTLYNGVVDCCIQVVRAEGPLALYKGFNGQWLRIGPHTTVSLVVFEQLRRLAGMAYL
mmetsp:Transcript_110808/g.220395  ORF Transcript_110808/g.220395 Transcript_110808/m.220395 type:complete len:306 (+) Transcript_110808:33-950(+)|eukprot:CAMPEP_0172667642 /NCGR_PEP_ID=MMETSP1074-20121228/8559_1 /TAXON_ID=2916 /ORGANISM="Ceratium fusus, Strain PA161109" /LENGTH=305 /DNA_ID=CAMNT_0013484179 /DNA_START=37 /DNA_END=954 /DNA_ORIENTATION=+